MKRSVAWGGSWRELRRTWRRGSGCSGLRRRLQRRCSSRSGRSQGAGPPVPQRLSENACVAAARPGGLSRSGRARLCGATGERARRQPGGCRARRWTEGRGGSTSHCSGAGSRRADAGEGYSRGRSGAGITRGRRWIASSPGRGAAREHAPPKPGRPEGRRSLDNLLQLSQQDRETIVISALNNQTFQTVNLSL